MEEVRKENIKTVVLIPALDPEREPLVQLVSGLLSHDCLKVLLIDDGSSSEKKAVFKECEALGCSLVGYDINKGKGAALKTGFDEILSKPDVYGTAGVITADSDGQHTVEDILKVRDEMLSHPDAFVLGVRDFSASSAEGTVPPKSLKGNRFTSKLFRFMYGRQMVDTQTGLRGIPYSFLPASMKISGDRYQYEMKVLIKAVHDDMEIVETPIKVIYFDSNKGTHFRPIKDSLKIIGVLLSQFIKYSIVSLSSSIVDIVAFALFSMMLANVIPYEHIIVSTYIARVISCIYNYILNRRVVFKADKVSGSKSLLRYIIAAALIASASALFVNVLYFLIRWNKTIIKIIVDTLLFFVSYKLQQKWVFGKK